MINSILRAIGLNNIALAWLSDERMVVLAITVAFIWQYIGLNALLFYAGINLKTKFVIDSNIRLNT